MDRRLVYNLTIFPNFSIMFSSVSYRISNVTWITPSLNFQVSFNACARIPLTLWVSTFYVVFNVTNAHKPMMQFMTPLSLLCEMLASTWDKNN